MTPFVVLYLLFPICGCSSMARIPAFQAGRVGSIPITRSKNPLDDSLRDFYFLPLHSYFVQKLLTGFFGSKK